LTALSERFLVNAKQLLINYLVGDPIGKVIQIIIAARNLKVTAHRAPWEIAYSRQVYNDNMD